MRRWVWSSESRARDDYAIRGRCASLLHLMLMCDRQPVAIVTAVIIAAAASRSTFIIVSRAERCNPPSRDAARVLQLHLHIFQFELHSPQHRDYDRHYGLIGNRCCVGVPLSAS